MDLQRLTPRNELQRAALVDGVLVAALLSIPLWAAAALAAIALFQDGPLTTLESAGFMLAAAAEALLLRLVWRRHGLKDRIRAVIAHHAIPGNPGPMLKRAALLGGLVLAYLHYYFWDVQLQIAQLHQLTVFI